MIFSQTPSRMLKLGKIEQGPLLESTRRKVGVVRGVGLRHHSPHEMAIAKA